MSLTLIANTNTTNNGLEALVKQVQASGLISLGASWESWFAAAADQLESDDSLDARLTDELADALGEAEEAISQGLNAQPALNRLVSLYNSTQAPLSLEEKWLKKAELLGMAQLETSTWNDLHKALDAAEAGRGALVARWISAVEETFIATWEGYETGDIIEDEITTESVLCHRFLQEGAELWLNALNELKDSLQSGQPARSSVLAQAEAGQRLLILVQLIEQEANVASNRFFAAWALN